MTIGDSLRYWLGYRPFLWLAGACATIAARFAPPGSKPPRPALHLTPPDDGQDDGPAQAEFTWA